MGSGSSEGSGGSDSPLCVSEAGCSGSEWLQHIFYL